MKAEEWDLIAEEYHENLISPFGKVLKNPLLEYIKKIKNKKTKLLQTLAQA